MSSKHTPGPWQVGFADGSGHSYITDSQGRVVVRGGYDSQGIKHGVVKKSNARLIAAAPKLLAIVARALRDGEQSHFEDWLERTCPSGDVESVKRQWLESSDYVLFANVYREELAVLDKIEGNT